MPTQPNRTQPTQTPSPPYLQGLGNVGCFAGGATACCLASLLLLLFTQFGDLGKDELVARRAKRRA